MRRFILVTALVLLSASAQAGPSRGLVLVSNDEPVIAEQSKTADAPKAVEAPKTEAKPAAKTEIKTETDAKSEVPKSVQRPAPVGTTAEKPKPKRESTEARVIYELHRHGIYW
jgi:outer membrane biosynthesis protein TonB